MEQNVSPDFQSRFIEVRLLLCLFCGWLCCCGFCCCWLCCWLGGLCSWLLLEHLLLLLCSFDLRFLGGQWFGSLNGLAVECTVLRCSALQFLVDWSNHTVLGTLDEAELETFEVGQVWALKWDGKHLLMIWRFRLTFSWTHLSLCLCTFSPQCLAPFLLQFKVLEGFLDDACWCCEWELDDELCQMQVAHWILLSGHTRQWTVDEYLKLSKGTSFSSFIFIVRVKSWSGEDSQKK